MLGIHPTSIVSPGARLHDSVRVGAYCFVGPDVVIGPDTELHPHTVVDGRVRIGARNVLESYCVVGGQPQDSHDVGVNSGVVLGDDNRLCRGVTVNRGTARGGGDTTIGNRNRLRAGSHVAHDCVIDDDCDLGEDCLLAGHIRMESGVRIDGFCGVHQWVTIGAFSRIRGGTRISQDVPPYMITGGYTPEVLGVNRELLETLGMRGEVIALLARSAQVLWGRRLPKPEALQQVLAEGGDVDEVRTLVAFLQASDRGAMGRRLEPRRQKSPVAGA